MLIDKLDQIAQLVLIIILSIMCIIALFCWHSAFATFLLLVGLYIALYVFNHNDYGEN